MQIVKQNQELAKQEQKPLEVGNLETALNCQQIRNTDEESLKQVLRMVMLKIGLRAQNMPSAEEKAVLIAHIYLNYPGHTPKEILLAFDMAISGKLDVEVNCYENFSCLYFSSIMTAYRIWAKEQVKEIKEPPMILHNILTTQEEKLQDIAEWEAKPKEKIIGHLIPPYLYDYLVEFGKINPTTEEKWELFERATQVRLTDLMAEAETGRRECVQRYQEFKKMKEEKKYSLSEAEILKNLSKKLKVFDWLKKTVLQKGLF